MVDPDVILYFLLNNKGNYAQQKQTVIVACKINVTFNWFSLRISYVEKL